MVWDMYFMHRSLKSLGCLHSHSSLSHSCKIETCAAASFLFFRFSKTLVFSSFSGLYLNWMAHSRPPVSGRRRSSIGKGAAAFDAFYTTSYVAPTPVKRSASDTFLYDRGREAHHRARQEERRRIRDELEHERKDSLSTCQLFCLTLCMVGVQFTCKQIYIFCPGSQRLIWFTRDCRAGIRNTIFAIAWLAQGNDGVGVVGRTTFW